MTTEPAPSLAADEPTPDWGAQYTLMLPTEDAARAAATELATRGHRLVAMREHDHFRRDPSSFWFGKPSMDPELEGWWQVFSLAVHVGADRGALDPVLRAERVRLAAVARDHAGFLGGVSEGHATTLQAVFSRVGLVHEDWAAVLLATTAELPAAPTPAVPAPDWSCPGMGDPTVLVAAAVAVAERLYGEGQCAPGAAAWLLDEEFNFGDPYDSAGHFLGDLADAVAHQGTCTPDTIASVPFLAELACDDTVAPGARVVLLGTLLDVATTGASLAVATADRHAALGQAIEEPEINRAVREAVGRELPRLLDRWAAETDAWHFVCTALAALRPGGTTPHLPIPVVTLPAPTGTRRAEILALLSALIDDDPTALDDGLRQVGAWSPRLAEKAASPSPPPGLLRPHRPRDARREPSGLSMNSNTEPNHTPSQRSDQSAMIRKAVPELPWWREDAARWELLDFAGQHTKNGLPFDACWEDRQQVLEALIQDPLPEDGAAAVSVSS